MGYATRYVPDWDECPSGQITLWDVPVLEPDWPDILTVQSADRPIVALIGLAERAEVYSRPVVRRGGVPQPPLRPGRPGACA